MAAQSKFSQVKLGVSLLLLCLLLGGVVFIINKNAAESLINGSAIKGSASDAQYFANNFPNLDSVIAGAPISAESKDFVAKALDERSVDQFKLYNSKGILVFDSEQTTEAIATSKNALPLTEVLDVLRYNKLVAQVNRQKSDDGDSLLTDVFLPISSEGKVIGVVEVNDEQISEAMNFEGPFALSTALVAAIAALGFAVPAFGFHLRSRQIKQADENLRFFESHDALTGLPNRNSFNGDLAKSLNTAIDNKKLSILHFIDIDFFKEINDRNGHDFGDEVLCAVAERLRNALREGDIVSRFGGDEFVVGQFGFANEEQIISATDRIVKVFKEPMRIRNSDIVLTASIGSAIGPQHGETPAQITKSADTAVYVVKARGRNSHCYFEPRFDEEKGKRMALEVMVRDAVANTSFELNFQPLYVFQTRQLKGFEALLRLQDPDGNAVSPTEFIPVAEEIGLIDEIGTWVLENACKTAATWPDELQISVNLSVAQFKRRSIVSSTKRALSTSGIAPHRLLLEITESLLMTDTDAILEQLKELKTLGVAIVMDDFGTGYSSLGYMLKFPFDRLKIDRSFVGELEKGNGNARTVVQTIISLGHTLNMHVTAEGVETSAQADALRNMNCDDAQGFLYGKPIAAVDIPELILNNFVKEIASTTAEMRSKLSLA